MFFNILCLCYTFSGKNLLGSHENLNIFLNLIKPFHIFVFKMCKHCIIILKCSSVIAFFRTSPSLIESDSVLFFRVENIPNIRWVDCHKVFCLPSPSVIRHYHLTSLWWWLKISPCGRKKTSRQKKKKIHKHKFLFSAAGCQIITLLLILAWGRGRKTRERAKFFFACMKYVSDLIATAWTWTLSCSSDNSTGSIFSSSLHLPRACKD